MYKLQKRNAQVLQVKAAKSGKVLLVVVVKVYMRSEYQTVKRQEQSRYYKHNYYNKVLVKRNKLLVKLLINNNMLAQQQLNLGSAAVGLGAQQQDLLRSGRWSALSTLRSTEPSATTSSIVKHNNNWLQQQLHATNNCSANSMVQGVTGLISGYPGHNTQVTDNTNSQSNCSNRIRNWSNTQPVSIEVLVQED